MLLFPNRLAAKLLLVSITLTAAFASTARNESKLSVSVLRVPNGGIQPQVLTDSAGTLHLIYFTGNPAHGDLFYVRSSDEGRTWSVPLRVNSQAGSAIALGTIRGGEIAIGKDGRVHVAWNGSSEAEPKGPVNTESGKRGEPMLYSRLNEAHTAFEPQRNLMTHTFGLDGGGTIAADKLGHVYVAWHGKAAGARAGEAGRQVWIAVSNDDGKTFSTERAANSEPTGACGCCGMAMYADSHGVLRALYRSATEDVHRDIYLLTSRDHAGTFSSQKLDPWNINACPMSSMAFAEDGEKVEGAWVTGGQVYFKALTNPDAIVISAPGPSKSRNHPRLSIAPGGATLLVWMEGTGWNRGGALSWQLYDSAGKPTAEKGLQAGAPTWSFAAVAHTSHGFVIFY